MMSNSFYKLLEITLHHEKEKTQEADQSEILFSMWFLHSRRMPAEL